MNVSQLFNAGLLNRDSEDLSCYMTEPRSRYAGFCTSLACTKGAARVEKLVDGTKDMCPDCGYYLVWRQTAQDMPGVAKELTGV